MKKVSLFLGMVLVASFAMAQNKATTVQNGISNVASVGQTGSNTGVVYQLLGNSNQGTLIQNGAGNGANLIQGLTDVANEIYGTANMAASNNIGYISQVGDNNKDVNVSQFGNKNYGVVDIQGSNNKAELQQGWSNWDGGHATFGNSNYSIVSQIGNWNFAGAWQYGGVAKETGYDNVNNITQNGGANSAQVAQGYIYEGQGVRVVYGENVTGNISNASQNGGSNNIRFMQLGSNNVLSLTQNGNGNTVGGMPGTGMVTYFQQTGNGNQFVGIQTGGATLEKTSAQDGDGNYINTVQGAGDVAKIIQDGDLNQAYLTQYGGGQNATILQTGTSNISSVTQGN